MDKIKVCHVVSALKSGGAESMIYNYCKHLPDDYSFSILHQYEAAEKNVSEFSELGFDIVRIPEKRKHPLGNYITTKKYLKNNRIEIVHCHMTVANFLPLLAAKHAGVKVRLSHAHETNFDTKGIINRVIINYLKRLCVRNATALIACGEKAGEYLYGQNKYYVLKNALEINRFAYNPYTRSALRKHFGIGDDEFIVGHIGRFIKVKNHDFIIRLFSELVQDTKRKYRLFLLGDGEEQARIRSACNQLGIKDKVVFTGVVNNPNDYYNMFDAFILPSEREGLPVVALEAQASGLKCFFSDTIDKDCIVDGGIAEMLPLDIDTWVESIKKTEISNSRNTSNSRLFETKGLDITKESCELDKLYKGCLNGKSVIYR